MKHVLIAALLLAGTAGAQPVDPVVAEAISLVRAQALNAPLVDWEKIEPQAATLAREAAGEAGRAKAIRHVLAALRDGHSGYSPPAPRGAGTTFPGISAPSDPIAVSEAPAGRFGRLAINGWVGGGRDELVATHAVRAALNSAMQHDACGLMLDVSRNRGGNMWPMMGGIAPLYDDGALQTFERRDGTRQLVNVADGWLRIDMTRKPAVADLPEVVRKPLYIALVVGARTASSAEVLALGFRYQDNVRSFGAATAGATSSRTSHSLANGGVVHLTTSRLRDRRGKVQDGPLVPDEIAYPPLEAATRWLGERCPQDARAEIAAVVRPRRPAPASPDAAPSPRH